MGPSTTSYLFNGLADSLQEEIKAVLVDAEIKIEVRQKAVCLTTYLMIEIAGLMGPFLPKTVYPRDNLLKGLNLLAKLSYSMSMGSGVFHRLYFCLYGFLLIDGLTFKVDC